MFNLEGRTALVTGASGVIGGAIAQKLAQQGARVAISGTRIQALEELCARIGDQCEVCPCDLSEPDAATTLVTEAEKSLGAGVDILVSNAGVTRDGLFMRMKDQDFQTVINLHLNVYFALARAVIRAMMRRKHGRIIGMASIIGVTGNPGQTNYAAAKAGMIGFSKALAHEVASRSVTVNCIAPGFIVSPMTEAIPDARKEAMLASIPARRLGSADDIAAAAAFLASDEAGYITGHTLHVNGGLAMI